MPLSQVYMYVCALCPNQVIDCNRGVLSPQVIELSDCSWQKEVLRAVCPCLDRQVSDSCLDRQVSDPCLDRQVSDPCLDRQVSDPCLDRQHLVRQTAEGPGGLLCGVTVPSGFPAGVVRTGDVPEVDVVEGMVHVVLTDYDRLCRQHPYSCHWLLLLSNEIPLVKLTAEGTKLISQNLLIVHHRTLLSVLVASDDCSALPVLTGNQ